MYYCNIIHDVKYSVNVTYLFR